jgi:hypothetical protein
MTTPPATAWITGGRSNEWLRVETPLPRSAGLSAQQLFEVANPLPRVAEQTANVLVQTGKLAVKGRQAPGKVSAEPLDRGQPFLARRLVPARWFHDCLLPEAEKRDRTTSPVPRRANH